MKVFAARPDRAQALEAVRRFFELLSTGQIQTAEALIAHEGDDWWPHQLRSLWQDLVGPWLEEQGEDWSLEDDASWRELGWLSRIDVDLEPSWDGASDDFFVNVLYDGAVTDVSAEFLLKQRDGGDWCLSRQAIGMA